MRFNAAQKQVIVYVGPAGSSDERAARQFAGVSAIEVLTLDSPKAVLFTADSAPGVYGILPLDDNLHGIFTESLTRIIFEAKQAIVCETLLLSERLFFQGLQPSVSPEVAYSHPAVLERFAPKLAENGIRAESVPTTRHACELIRAKGNPSRVAIAPDVVASKSGLTHITNLKASSFQVNTRYALVGRASDIHLDAIGLLLFVLPLDDKVGTLANVLDILKQNNLNLTEIRSIRMAPGSPHGFLLEILGSFKSLAVQATLKTLVQQNIGVKVIGCCELNNISGDDLTNESVPHLIQTTKDLNQSPLTSQWM